MQHPDEGTIHAWLDGALSPEEAAHVESHANECPECAAAVAEARGFIAASSRILTALDNVPRGVIPVTAPKRRFDPFVWRIAATLLVVAAGTLVVVRTRGTDEGSQASVADSAGSTRTASTASAPAAAIGSAGAANEAAPMARLQTPPASRSGSAVKAAPKTASQAAPTPGGRGAMTDNLRGAVSGGAGEGDQRRAMNKTAAADAAMSAPAPAMPAAPSEPQTRADFAQTDRAAQTEPLRVIATPRRLGANVTVYVIGGDTVTLAESVPVRLESAIATGVTAQRQISEKAAARAPRPTAAAAVPDTQTRATPAPPAAAVFSGQAVLGAQAANVITWSDPTTGSTLTLTGKISPARLEQLKLRIERERAAAAAAKKNP